MLVCADDSGLFPPGVDVFAAQRALEAFLLRPAPRVRAAIDAALAPRPCAVGLHLRGHPPEQVKALGNATNPESVLDRLRPAFAARTGAERD